MSDLSVLIAESLDPDDFYDRRLDGYAANEVLRIQNVRSSYRVVLDNPRLRKSIAEAAGSDFTVYHLSCHGDDDGITLADEGFIPWLEFARLMTGYATLDRILVLSCCSGGYVAVTKALAKAGCTFGYVFGSSAEEGVGYTDSCLAWSMLYSRFAESGFSRSKLRQIIDKINFVVPGSFVYRRWDGTKYLRYPTFATRT